MTFIFCTGWRTRVFALKYVSEQRRLHIEKTFQGCSSPEAPSDPLHIQFLISALTKRAIRALSCLRTKFAYPLRTHRPAKEASLEAICDCDVDGWSSEVTLWTHLYNSPLTGGHHWWWPLPCVCVLSSYLYRLVDVAFLFYVSCSIRRWWVAPGHGASSGVSQSGSHLSAHMYLPPIKKYKVRGIKIEIIKWLIYVFSYPIIVMHMRTAVVNKDQVYQGVDIFETETTCYIKWS